METIILVGIVVVLLLFLEAGSLSGGADSRDGIGDDHARPSRGAM